MDWAGDGEAGLPAEANLGEGGMALGRPPDKLRAPITPALGGAWAGGVEVRGGGGTPTPTAPLL